jgi:hypothetical protein
MQVKVNRCKCGKFARREDCPKCRQAHAREDKIVAFLIGDVVRVVKPVIVPVEAVICWEG